ncbi:hypothetical protein KRR38_32215 [Novosphingobium sp. G106]|uniref:hypothetical protein n=1 Tax=Novosphingobium sp. G106 TaxID=2849500 RepID=UPI001C2D98DA|nr:hypothetical protein [Novosphingobium sp. G106]MBV1692204.1 hypothetical protein [Novosphingobium sp. G106]
MTAHAQVTRREHQLEEVLRGMCHHFTLMQLRASYYLPDGNAETFIDVLGMLDGPDQRRVQSAARKLLNEPQSHIRLQND